MNSKLALLTPTNCLLLLALSNPLAWLLALCVLLIALISLGLAINVLVGYALYQFCRHQVLGQTVQPTPQAEPVAVEESTIEVHPSTVSSIMTMESLKSRIVPVVRSRPPRKTSKKDVVLACANSPVAQDMQDWTDEQLLEECRQRRIPANRRWKRKTLLEKLNDHQQK